MKIKNIIEFLESQGDWVNRHFTRDHILIGTDRNRNKKCNCLLGCNFRCNQQSC